MANAKQVTIENSGDTPEGVAAQEFMTLVEKSLPHAAAGMFRDYLARLTKAVLEGRVEAAAHLQDCIGAAYSQMNQFLHYCEIDADISDDDRYMLNLMADLVNAALSDSRLLLGEEQMAGIFED